MDVDVVWIVITALLIPVGGMQVVIGELARRGRLPRNRFFGIPLPATTTDDQAWKRAHRAAGGWLSLAGLALVVAGVVRLLASQLKPASTVAVALFFLLLWVAKRRALRVAMTDPEYSQQS